MKTLKQETMEIINNMVVMNEMTIEKVIAEILTYGCINGIVADLTYYYQTEAFFDRHKDEINAIARGLSIEIFENPYELYYNLKGGCSKNTMAWFGFEETTREIADELEIEY